MLNVAKVVLYVADKLVRLVAKVALNVADKFLLEKAGILPTKLVL